MTQTIGRSRIKRIILLLSFLAGSHFYLSAQNPILLECMNINKAYMASNHLSFNVKYTYAKEVSPTDLVDSTLAVYKLNGYKYWGSIDSVEFMQNDSFQIALYQPEQVLSIGLPSFNYTQYMMPLTRWDSLFFKNDQFTYSTGVDSIYKKITVDYSAGLPFKKFEMWYDSVSYRIHRIKYLMDDQVSDQSYALSGALSGNYVIINIVYSNYQTGVFTDSVFNSGNYFHKSGGSYVPVSPYSDYQVFLSSPGLE